MAKIDEQDFTHISAQTALQGDITGNSNVRVAGKIKGSIVIQGDLVIEKSGSVEGEIQAKTATVAGSIQGNIQCSEKLILEQTSSLVGNIHTKQLVIENGAHFQGNCSMGSVSETAKSKSTT